MLAWAKQVADEEKAPFVDHSNITADAYEKMGEQDVAKFFRRIIRTRAPMARC